MRIEEGSRGQTGASKAREEDRTGSHASGSVDQPEPSRDATELRLAPSNAPEPAGPGSDIPARLHRVPWQKLVQALSIAIGYWIRSFVHLHSRNRTHGSIDASHPSNAWAGLRSVTWDEHHRPIIYASSSSTVPALHSPASILPPIPLACALAN